MWHHAQFCTIMELFCKAKYTLQKNDQCGVVHNFMQSCNYFVFLKKTKLSIDINLMAKPCEHHTWLNFDPHNVQWGVYHLA